MRGRGELGRLGRRRLCGAPSQELRRVHDAASAIIAPDADHLPAYRLFREAVARAQLAAWLPRGRQVLVDVSGPRAATAELAARAGHTVDLPHAEVVLVPWPDGTITTSACGRSTRWAQ